MTDWVKKNVDDKINYFFFLVFLIVNYTIFDKINAFFCQIQNFLQI